MPPAARTRRACSARCSTGRPGSFRFAPSNTMVPASGATCPGTKRARDDVAHADGLGDHDRSPRRRSDTRATTACANYRRAPGDNAPARHAAAHGDVHERPGRDGGQLPAVVRLRRHRRASGATTARATAGVSRRRATTSPSISCRRWSSSSRWRAAAAARRSRRATRCSSRCRGRDDAPATLDEAQEQLPPDASRTGATG